MKQSGSIKKLLQFLPFAFGLIAIGLLFKSCDGGKTEETKRSTNAGTTDTGVESTGSGETDEEDAEAEADGTTDQTDGQTGDTVYTLNVDMEDYADTDITSFQFFIDSKDGSKQTLLKEVAVTSEFDFTKPAFKFVSSELSAIAGFVDSETCLTVKAVRGGLASDESEPLCFTEW